MNGLWMGLGSNFDKCMDNAAREIIYIHWALRTKNMPYIHEAYRQLLSSQLY